MRDARIYFALRVFVSKQPHKNASSGFRLRGPSLRDEPEIVRSALKHRGFDLQFASPRLRNDRQMVRTAVKQDYRALEFASSEMRDDDPGIVYTAVRKNSAALKFASMAVLDNTDFAFAVIEKYPDALYELSSQLHNYRKVVLDAVKREGLVLQYASDELRDDWGVAFAAIRSYPDAIRYIGPTLPQRSQMGACGYQERSVVVSGNKPRVAQRSLVRPGRSPAMGSQFSICQPRITRRPRDRSHCARKQPTFIPVCQSSAASRSRHCPQCNWQLQSHLGRGRRPIAR